MVIELTNPKGEQVKRLDADLDMDLNNTRDFELYLAEQDKDLSYLCRVFCAGTEYGGMLGELKTDTAKGQITWGGLTWRGLLEKKILKPLHGQDYLTVSGELNDILRDLIVPRFNGLFAVPQINTGITATYQFNRYCTLLDGVEELLKKYNHRLQISYNEGKPNQVGFVEIQAVRVKDFSDQIELSQDSRLDFNMKDKKNGVNHLICLGKGELRDREVIDLYLQKDGSIDQNPFYVGIEEVEETYENSSSENLLEDGKKKFLELLKDSKTFEMDLSSLGMDIDIGDIVGGRDQLTGMYLKKPIGNIILKIKDGKLSKEYKLEG